MPLIFYFIVLLGLITFAWVISICIRSIKKYLNNYEVDQASSIAHNTVKSILPNLSTGSYSISVSTDELGKLKYELEELKKSQKTEKEEINYLILYSLISIMAKVKRINKKEVNIKPYQTFIPSHFHPLKIEKPYNNQVIHNMDLQKIKNEIISN